MMFCIIYSNVYIILPSATNGYSCPSLMPGSISTSNIFSSGTNLKNKSRQIIPQVKL